MSDRRYAVTGSEREAPPRDGTTLSALDRILVATDFSPGAERALELAIELGRVFRSSIDLVHVYPPVTYASAPPGVGTFPAVPSPAALENIEVALAEVAERVRAAGLDCRTLSTEGEAAREIAARAAENRANLIVMGTHGRTGFRRLLLGSVAEGTLRNARCPVLVVPDGEGREESTAGAGEGRSAS